jgi:hypothetical protein
MIAQAPVLFPKYDLTLVMEIANAMGEFAEARYRSSNRRRYANVAQRSCLTSSVNTVS